jgi:hypothetical protein
MKEIVLLRIIVLYRKSKKIYLIYIYISMFPRKFDKYMLSFILNIILQESLQDPDIYAVPPITTRYQESTESPALHIHLTVPQS